MYRGSSDYDIIAEKAIDIFLDYNITEFPVNEVELCRKLGVKLIPYSDCPIEISSISNDAFYITPTKTSPPIILYNDEVSSEGRKRFSIFHELKHYVCCDNEETAFGEDMANYFSKYIMCPVPVLIYRNVNDTATIMSDYNTSWEVAEYVLRNLRNRRNRFQDKIFEYEQPLIDLIFNQHFC